MKKYLTFVASFQRNAVTMKVKEFFHQLASKAVLFNLLAIILVGFALLIGTSYVIEAYTNHGEKVVVPSLRHKSFDQAKQLLKEKGLRIEVSDTGYVKTLPPDCILEQGLEPGQIVKPGRIVTVIINSTHTPTITLPDIIDNSSLREAMAKLTSLGFKLGQPEFITGEKDWVYGVKVNGKNVVTGAKIPVDAVLIIQAGNGMQSEADSITFYIPDVEAAPEFEEEGEFEEIEIVEEPVEPTTTAIPTE